MIFYTNLAMNNKDVKLGLDLEPVWWNKRPAVLICLNGRELFSGSISQTVSLDWLLPAQDRNRFTVELCNKEDADTRGELDMAVKILRLRIEDFALDSFMYLADYRPVYSRGYYQYAQDNNLTVDPVIKSNYLGFNGQWSIEFTWPAFTWIHEIEHLGWIHEKNL